MGSVATGSQLISYREHQGGAERNEANGRLSRASQVSQVSQVSRVKQASIRQSGPAPLSVRRANLSHPYGKLRAWNPMKRAPCESGLLADILSARPTLVAKSSLVWNLPTSPTLLLFLVPAFAPREAATPSPIQVVITGSSTTIIQSFTLVAILIECADGRDCACGLFSP
jgi:hypothetical protein